MLRPQVKTGDGAWEGLAWALERHGGGPMLFTHAGQDAAAGGSLGCARDAANDLVRFLEAVLRGVAAYTKRAGDVKSPALRCSSLSLKP
jgi:hypothetical protein